MTRTRFFILLFSLCVLMGNPIEALSAERFYISIPGPSLSYTPLFYGQDSGFFSDEGLDLKVLVVRGQVGISSLMAGEIDVTCHAGSGFAASLRGLPIKIISVTHDLPEHELVVAPSIKSASDLKGKNIAIGSLEGTAAVVTRRVLQAKGLDPSKDVVLIGTENSGLRYQALLSGNVAGAMMTPPGTFLAQDQGYKILGRGRDYMRYLQTGVVTTDANIKQKRANIVRFLRAWNRSVRFYQDNRELMIPYIQKKLGVADAQLARRMYDDDAPHVSLSGTLTPDGAKEILDTGREALRIKETIPNERIFDFSLAAEATR